MLYIIKCINRKIYDNNTCFLNIQYKAYMMKYLQLKFVILFQQANKFVGKYCFYGCWCFPQAAMFQWQGFGQPVDNIG